MMSIRDNEALRYRSTIQEMIDEYMRTHLVQGGSGGAAQAPEQAQQGQPLPISSLMSMFKGRGTGMEPGYSTGMDMDYSDIPIPKGAIEEGPGYRGPAISRALGGDVLPGVPYMVGEEGPEKLMVTTPGKIVPLNNGGGSTTPESISPMAPGYSTGMGMDYGDISAKTAPPAPVNTGPKIFGVSKNDFVRVLGMAAHAIGPNTIGGRMGAGAVTLANEQDTRDQVDRRTTMQEQHYDILNKVDQARLDEVQKKRAGQEAFGARVRQLGTPELIAKINETSGFPGLGELVIESVANGQNTMDDLMKFASKDAEGMQAPESVKALFGLGPEDKMTVKTAKELSAFVPKAKTSTDPIEVKMARDLFKQQGIDNPTASQLIEGSTAIKRERERPRLLSPEEEAQQTRIAGGRAGAAAQAVDAVRGQSGFATWTPEAKQNTFMYNVITGKPPVNAQGMGSNDRKVYGKEYAEWQVKSGFKPQDISLMQADYRAGDMSLKNMTKQEAPMAAFVGNINKQIDKVQQLYDNNDRVGLRLIDLPVRELKIRALGSGDEAVKASYLLEISNEIGKLSSGASASVQQLSDSAKEDWKRVHDPSLSFKEIMKVVNATKDQANMRIQSWREAKQQVRQELKNLGVAETPQAPTPSGGVTIDPSKIKKGW